MAEHCNGSLGFTNGWKFLDQLKHYEPLNEDCALWCFLEMLTIATRG